MIKKEIEHHIKEAKKLLKQGRFTIQEVNEKLDFLMGDLHIVLNRMKSISIHINTAIQESNGIRGQMQQRLETFDTDEKKHGLYCDKCGELRSNMLVTKKEAMDSSGLCGTCQHTREIQTSQYLNPKTKALDIKFIPIEPYENKGPMLECTYDMKKIGTVQDRASDALAEFDKKVEKRRQELLNLFDPKEYDFFESEIMFTTDDIAKTVMLSKRIGAEKKDKDPLPSASNYELDKNHHCPHPQKAHGDMCQCMWCVNCGKVLVVCKLHTKEKEPIHCKTCALSMSYHKSDEDSRDGDCIDAAARYRAEMNEHTNSA